MTPRRLIQLAAVAVLLGGVALSFGPARVTWLNTGLRIDYPWGRGGAALIAAAGAVLLAALVPSPRLRPFIGALAAVLVLFGCHLLLYRLDAGGTALSQRGLLGSTAVAWAEVARVETGTGALVITDRAEVQVRVGLGDLAPDQRASLERTVARRVRERSAPPAPGP